MGETMERGGIGGIHGALGAREGGYLGGLTQGVPGCCSGLCAAGVFRVSGMKILIQMGIWGYPRGMVPSHFLGLG